MSPADDTGQVIRALRNSYRNSHLNFNFNPYPYPNPKPTVFFYLPSLSHGFPIVIIPLSSSPHCIPLVPFPSFTLDHWKIRLPAIGRKFFVVPVTCLKPSQWESAGKGQRRQDLSVTKTSSTSLTTLASASSSSSSVSYSSSLTTLKKKAKMSHHHDVTDGQPSDMKSPSPNSGHCPINALNSSVSSTSPAAAVPEY